MKIIYKATFLFFATYIFTQTSLGQQFQKFTSPPVIVNGNPLPNAWAGGLSAPIFNTIDLNNDGIKDLFLFDKQWTFWPNYHKIRTFINNGTPNKVDYVYAPQYESKFPQNLWGWALLVDYDCDGNEDIFTYTSAGGMSVYHNDFTPGNGISFSLEYSLVWSWYGGSSYANLYVSNANLPVLKDINGDNDLDVLTFNILGGSLEYHENMAQELYNRCDTLVFYEQRRCWGAVGLSPFRNAAFLNYCHNFTGPAPDEKSGLHNGSCLIGYDEGGDGDIDLINGDIVGDSLLYLENSPNLLSPLNFTDSIVMQDSAFPVYDSTANYKTFPAPYIFDANNDGKEDLIVSSCTEYQSENYKNNMFYENIGDNNNHNFHYTKNRLLTDEMIDVGSGSNVTFFDADADGKKDLIVGNYGYFISNAAILHHESALSFYKNTTTGMMPSFTFMSVDYSNLQQYNLINMKPTFGDLDGDLDEDMLIGNADGNLFMFENTAGVGNPASFTLAANGINYQNIDIGNNSMPQLIDVDYDNLLDLIIGETFGNIWYYHNTGTAANPVFTYITNIFGGVDVRDPNFPPYGYSAPHMYVENGQHKLVVGNQNGFLFLYDNIDGNLSGNFNLVSSSAFNVYEPYRSNPDMEDLNGDGSPEIIVGNFAGGLSFYSTSLTSFQDTNAENNDIGIYPNPATDNLIIDFKNREAQERIITIFDVPGQLIKRLTSHQAKEIISVKALSAGVYFVKVTEDDFSVIKKIVIK